MSVEVGAVSLTRAERRRYLPMVLPLGWQPHGERSDGGAYYNAAQRLGVIVSLARELDGKLWLHVSCSHPDAIPSWDELKAVKDLFIGREKLALQVLPPASRYINVHPFVLHLWHCLDGDPVPDFAHGEGII